MYCIRYGMLKVVLTIMYVCSCLSICNKFSAMKKLERIKRLKNIRIHREGTEILLVSLLLLLLINVPLWYFLPSFVVLNSIVSVVTITIYLLMVNFFLKLDTTLIKDIGDKVLEVKPQERLEIGHLKTHRLIFYIPI